MAAFAAFDAAGPVRAGGQQAQLAKNLTRLEFDIELGDQVLAFDRQEHFVGEFAFAEENVSLAVFAPGHERLEPVHRQIAARGAAHLLDQFDHLIKAIGVQRQQQAVEENRRKRARQDSRAQETERAGNGRYAQGNDRFHRNRRDVE